MNAPNQEESCIGTRQGRKATGADAMASSIPKIPSAPIDLDQDQFGRELHVKLSPSDAIQTPELLRGRAVQLDEIRQALYSAGRQIFIYGDRGVGKTSLAQTAAFQRQSSDQDPILVACSPSSSCFSIVR